MAYNVEVAGRLRESLMNLKSTEEKKMFGGVCFMVDGNMCMGVIKNDLMCRINPEKEEFALQKRGVRPMY
jgi:TfoX/Sxy family transcriptional regulator of competence genes